ncbi:MAG: hypothetical protein BroJett011_25980 [Chloroflexota bacterium]|nr:MAG: hypothetical protein BroJett011_25980 [Chloroflexota bacterium]
MALRIIPLIVSAFLLGAHFLRQGNLWLVGLCLLALGLLWVKKRWSLIVLQFLAYLGALIWASTAISIVQQRLALGEPWLRVAIILGAVVLLSVLAGLLLNTPAVKERYSP